MSKNTNMIKLEPFIIRHKFKVINIIETMNI